MTTETMTVHKALAELKVMDSRIVNTINAGFYVTANKHSNEKIKGKSIDDFKTNAKAQNDKVNDLINRRNAMKRAVVLSNATTKVTIGDTQYTVAEAIELKNHGLEFKKLYMNALNTQKLMAEKEILGNSGDAIERRAERFILDAIQAQPKDSKMSVDSDSMKTLRKEYIANNTYDLIDPLGVDGVIEKLREEIDTFSTEIDSSLSVSNALTTITFEY